MEYCVLLNWHVCGCLWVKNVGMTGMLANLFELAIQQGFVVATMTMGFVVPFCLLS